MGYWFTPLSPLLPCEEVRPSGDAPSVAVTRAAPVTRVPLAGAGTESVTGASCHQRHAHCLRTAGVPITVGPAGNKKDPWPGSFHARRAGREKSGIQVRIKVISGRDKVNTGNMRGEGGQGGSHEVICEQRCAVRGTSPRKIWRRGNTKDEGSAGRACSACRETRMVHTDYTYIRSGVIHKPKSGSNRALAS